ncbi:major facilitator superfamily transporter [Microlunatus phosphovorus NM-1]|uniref:Major facilitator superfamily transporter n=1 Tax=Microlunatus phosphovorus (strain ATCC 700054 / DSM 10555 / JCM 9379 / NBRC 101784 / NCIMB 13414 / VKM Ac-1990 / NM-1) TaxID=1032480 RepID=F5XJN0_MICPN|nr:MFS transporter [Microlunatus phosphovorus]BAK35930.1 major facilitator superfamily transporter [Microlunatus phosphovorus NM-1]
MSTETQSHSGQSKKAAASGWIGSALEYYDFFIYAQAAALIFPLIMFDKSDPQMAIIGALGTYAVGYVARPIGAFVLGAWGDKHGRKNVLVLCMLLMGFSTMAVAVLPTYQQVGIVAPSLLMVLRLVQGFAVAGEISGASSMIMEHAPLGRRGYLGSFTLQGTQFGQILAAAVFLPLAHFLSEEAFHSWGWRIPFALSAFVVVAGYFIRKRVDETHTAADNPEGDQGSPVAAAWRDSRGSMIRVFCMALTNIVAVTTAIFGATYATNKDYGIGFHADVYLWIPLLGNLVAVIVIPVVGNLSDKIGRRPCLMVSTIACGLMSYGYLWAISTHSVPLAIIFSLVMWGAVYQGYNAVFPAFYPEQFPAKNRVSGMAISQNMGTVASSAMVLVFPLVAGPGSSHGHVIFTVGTITLALCVIACLGAFFSPETYRFRAEDLDIPGSKPLPKAEYMALRDQAIAEAKSAKVSA